MARLVRLPPRAVMVLWIVLACVFFLAFVGVSILFLRLVANLTRIHR